MENFAQVLASRARTSRLLDAHTGQDLVCDLASASSAFGTLNPAERAPVAILCDQSPESALAYLGAMYAGHVVLPVDAREAPERRERLFRLAGVTTAWAPSEKVAQSLSGLRVLRGLSGGEPPREPPAFGELACLMATSGSADEPRLVRVTHANLLANTEAIATSQGLDPDDRAMLILPLHYCFGASVLHSHLWVGGSVVFDRRFMFVEKVLDALESYGCTTFAGVPMVYHTLLARSTWPTRALPSLRRYLQAGGGLSESLLAEVNRVAQAATVFVLYGQTEATARLTTREFNTPFAESGHVGWPIRGVTIEIRDESGAPLPPDAEGEVWVCGPSVTAGYLNDEEGTSARWVDGWLRTMDMGRKREDGALVLTGRAGDFLKIRGRRVGLRQIEAQAEQVFEGATCAACGLPSEQGEVPVVFVVRPEQKGRVPIPVAQWRHSFDPQHAVRACVAVQRLPLTARGKVDRRTLRAWATMDIDAWEGANA